MNFAFNELPSALADGKQGQDKQGFSRISNKIKFLIALAKADRMIDILFYFG